MTPTGKTIATFVKFMVWFGVAAALDWALANMGILNLPLWSIPLVAAALKAAATYVATLKAQK